MGPPPGRGRAAPRRSPRAEAGRRRAAGSGRRGPSPRPVREPGIDPRWSWWRSRSFVARRRWDLAARPHRPGHLLALRQPVLVAVDGSGPARRLYHGGISVAADVDRDVAGVGDQPHHDLLRFVVIAANPLDDALCLGPESGLGLKGRRKRVEALRVAGTIRAGRVEAGSRLAVGGHLGAPVLVGRVDDDLPIEPAGCGDGIVPAVPGDSEDDHLTELGGFGGSADAGRVPDLGRQRLQLRRVAAAQLHLVSALGELPGAVAADPPGADDSDPHPGAPFTRSRWLA